MVLSSANPNSNQSTASRSLHDAVSVAGSRLQDVVSSIQKPGTRTNLAGLREGWDSLVRVAFAPCAGDIGGVPRQDMNFGNDADAGTAARSRTGAPDGGLGASGRSRTGNSVQPSWGASVPFEVSASQDKSSSFQLSVQYSATRESSFSQHTRDLNDLQQYPVQQQRQQYPVQQMAPRDERKAKSRARLRQLGAQHQLAGGFPGETLADAARPISVAEREQELAAAEALYSTGEQHSPDDVDFDDGISAISSHTLEEMERRRQIKVYKEQRQHQHQQQEYQQQKRENVVRLHALDFSQIIDENEEVQFVDSPGLTAALEDEESNTEVVFGDPFYEADQDQGLYQNVRTVVDDCHAVAHDEFAPASDFERVTSSKTNRTQNTTITEDSHEFEEMHKRHEAMYWVDQDEVANNEKTARSRSRSIRQSQGMSIEERARRLRELSRSRSRSDGTGSSNKSGASSLVSGQHPHDTVPVYSSDLFTRRRKSTSSKNTSRSRKSSQDNFVTGSDPFGSLDYGEI